MTQKDIAQKLKEEGIAPEHKDFRNRFGKEVFKDTKLFEEFKKEFEAKNGGDAYVAISIKDYENLSKNFAELRRYIEQQKAIIVYYENAVQPLEDDSESDD